MFLAKLGGVNWTLHADDNTVANTLRCLHLAPSLDPHMILRQRNEPYLILGQVGEPDY